MKTIDYIESFLSAKNNHSTRVHYRRSLSLFTDYLYEMGLGYESEIDLSRLIPIMTSDDKILYYAPVDHILIEDFLMFRKLAGDTQRTLASHYQFLKGFFNTLVKLKYLAMNPIELVDKVPFPMSKETTYLDEEECILLLIAAALSDFPERNFALTKTMICCGFRPRELRELQIADLDVFRKCIYIGRWKKTGRIRTLPLYDQLYRDIKTYLDHERRKDKAAPQVFLNDQNPFSDKDMLNLVKDLVKDAGITKPFTPKGFRHTTATLLFVKDVDISYIKELLGHKKLKTTMVYTHHLTSIPDDPRLSPNADLLSGFNQKNFRRIDNLGYNKNNMTNHHQ